jgi:hypothetical protein
VPEVVDQGCRLLVHLRSLCIFCIESSRMQITGER